MSDDVARRCGQCGETKLLTEFHRDRKDTRLGRARSCKECAKAIARRWRQDNPERARAQELRRDRAQRAAEGRAYGERNLAAIQERERERQRRNRARRNEQRRASRARNLDRARRRDRERNAIRRQRPEEQLRILNYTARRRALLAGAFVEDVDRREVFRRHEGRCGFCGEQVDPEAWDIDHIVPLAHGGEHSYANTRPSHPACNRAQGTRVRYEAEAA